MELPRPFVYPDKPHARRHAPAGYRDYRDYKPWLRDEFAFRCVYCLERERWYPDRAASFSADHVIPQRGEDGDPSRVCDYTNLVYACTRCNSLKQGVIVLDPAGVAMGEHLLVTPDGSIRGLSWEGERLIRLLRLDADPALQVRRYYLELLALKAEFPGDQRVHRLFSGSFCFPDDLPDLMRPEPPGGNARAENRRDSYFARRERGELPETY